MGQETEGTELQVITTMPRVVAAAIRIGTMVYSLPSPARHHDVISDMRLNRGVRGEQDETWEQGFLLDDGRFANRRQAASIALRVEQIAALKWPPNLYSEDLW